MLPLRCNIKWRQKSTTKCRWFTEILGKTNHDSYEDEAHIMSSSCHAIHKHGENIMDIIPNLNDETPFVKKSPLQWRVLGSYLENINRDLQQDNDDDDPMNPIVPPTRGDKSLAK